MQKLLKTERTEREYVMTASHQHFLPLAFGEHDGHKIAMFGVHFCQSGKLRANAAVARRAVEFARD